MELIIEENENKNKSKENIFFEKFNVKYKSTILNLWDENIPLVISYENNMLSSSTINFERTLNNNGWEYIFIGEGEAWNGFSNKINGYFNVLSQFSPNKIIILSDGRDVLCCRSPKSYMSKITDMMHSDKIIISAELVLLGKMNWTQDEYNSLINANPNYFWQGIPLFNYWKFYNLMNCIPSRKYVNSGLISGTSSNLLQLFNWIFENNILDDQLGVSMYTDSHPARVHLDTGAEILHTSTHGVNLGLLDMHIQRHDAVNFAELMGHSSYFLHIPGLSGSNGQKRVYAMVNDVLKSYKLHSGYSQEMYGLGTDNGQYDPIYVRV